MVQCKKVLFLSVLIVVVTQSLQSPVGSTQQDDNQNVDLNVDLSCIANSTCVKNVSNKVIRALHMKKLIDFGAFTIEPLKSVKKNEGRSMSKLANFINGNAIRVPLGSYSLSLQKSEEYDNYLEVAVSKTVEGRGRHERKQMQFFVPSFLVASQVGWWLLALAGVALLSIKALLVSKIALIVGSIMTIKKLFEHHHGIAPHYYEHHEPLMVPYNFDLSGFSAPGGFPGEFHPSLPLGHEQTAALHQNGALGAETNNVITNITNGTPSMAQTPGLSAYSTVARHPPLNFNYLGKNPFLYRKP